MTAPVRIKICGVTTVDDARAAVAAGADALGLNFYPASVRFLALERAAAIADAVRGDIGLVGLFVNASRDEIAAAHAAVGFDLVQLHGDEPPALAAALAPWPVLRAVRCRDAGSLAAATDDLNAMIAAGANLAGVIVDAYAAGQFGGTGEVVDWRSLAPLAGQIAGRPLILAGGLTAGNVAEAIRTARPTGVDVASGVESSPGVKDPAQVAAFVAAARQALEALS